MYFKEFYMKNKIWFLAKLAILIVFIIVFIGCATKLSAKAIEQNIRVVTSRSMVEGMTMFHSYTQMGQASSISNAFQDIANKAANRAAEEGHRDITVLVVVAEGSGGWHQEVSYWR
jgi:glucan phosphoethanolaminetransferase (alkaline phosphatase superfamily)